MQEQIRDIKGYEGRYQVTNTGKIFSLPNGSRKGIRELKQEISKRKCTSYRRITLSVNAKPKRYQVHQLMAIAFIPNPDNKPFINHIDNNGENNFIDPNDLYGPNTNIEWCTHKENMKHSFNQGRQDLVKKLGGKATATIKKIKTIKKLKSLLNNRLITTSIYSTHSGTRRKVTYQCKYCNNVFSRRSDSPAVLRGGVCTDCYRDDDMI